MTIEAAMHIEQISGIVARTCAIFAVAPDFCHVCGELHELRAGVCFDCKEKVETDLLEVWEIAKPENRWKYQYRVGGPV